MIITIFISMKFRIGYQTEIADYMRDCIEVDSDASPESVAEIINKRIDSLSITLNKSISSQLHDQVA